MVRRLSLNESVFKDTQFLNASYPIKFRCSPKLIFSNAVSPEKAYDSILVQEFPILAETRELQFLNAPESMLVTVFGIFTEVRETQSPNAYSPIFTSLDPKDTVLS